MLDNLFLVGLNVVLACFALYYHSRRNNIQEKVNTKIHDILREAEDLARKKVNEAEYVASERVKEAENVANKTMAEANDRERIAKKFIEMTGREYPILAKVIADYQSAQDFAEANYILSTRRLVPGTKKNTIVD